MQNVECVGKTVEDAITAALKKLEAKREDVDIEVLDEGAKGLLGFGSKLARVRATKKAVVGDAGVAFLKQVAALMGVNDITVDVSSDSNVIHMEVQGDTVSTMIGHRGETLDALQLLTSLVINPQGHDSQTYQRLSLDVGGYRSRRQAALTQMAIRMAERVLETGEPQQLEPMNSYERRIVHTALSDYEDITTFSRGEEPNRHIVIALRRDDYQDAQDDEEE